MKNSENEFKAVQELIALKRYETPGEEYFESFVDNFHRRQRQELMAEREKSGLAVKFQGWFSQLGWGKALLGAGAAYAAIALMISFGGVEQSQMVDTPLPNTFGSDSIHVNMEVDHPVNFAPSPLGSELSEKGQLGERARSRQEF